MPRALDHLVLPTASVAIARERLTALGFTVAPTGVHPFGTENCCVYFPGGAFLEPLAVRDPAIVGDSAARGNVFVARDGAFRSLRGDEGFSAVVLATDDADADHDRLRSRGLSAGNMLTFSRPFADPSGRTGTATFKLAFGAAPAVADGFFFSCERVGVPAVDRTALERHDNAVTGIAEVALTGQSASAMLDSIAWFADGSASEGIVDLGDTIVRCHGTAAFSEAFGIDRPADAPPFAAISFRAASLVLLATLFSSHGIDYMRVGARIIVPPAPGQGATFIFEESS